MINFYLYTNAVLYFLFSAWCLFRFKTTSEFLGYSFLNNSGKSEYLTVYTGMEFGFAVFLALCGYFSSLRFSGLVFCVALYTGIVLVRVNSILYFKKVENTTYMVGGLELALLIWGAILLASVGRE